VALRREKLVVLIVSYGNPADVVRCLKSLANSDWKEFEVFICENAGLEAFENLLAAVSGTDGPVVWSDECSEDLDQPGGRLEVVVRCRLSGSSNVVHLAAAAENLGYGGGVNAWLERIVTCPGWDAALVLNPDTEVAPACLSELVAKKDEGFGMVGGTLVFDDTPSRIINYGLAWSRLTGRITAVGRGARAGTAPSTDVLASIDAISGACVLVSRAFVEEIGLMPEDYFLYMEDLDWGRRRGRQKIGFAPKAVIRHVCGTSIGSAVDPRQRSRLSVYLMARNSVLYARREAGWLWIFHAAAGVLYAAKYALAGAPTAARVTLEGLFDGAKGMSGRPNFRME
jgi:N-acetylglucosaminyl-diphospho-decaprenol L-rhamnosyltransferase